MSSDLIRSFLEKRTAPLILVSHTSRVNELVCKVSRGLKQAPPQARGIPESESEATSAAVLLASRILGQVFASSAAAKDVSAGGSEEGSLFSSQVFRFISLEQLRRGVLVTQSDVLGEFLRKNMVYEVTSGLASSQELLSQCLAASLQNSEQRELSLGQTSFALIDFLSVAAIGLPHSIFDHIFAHLVFADIADSPNDIALAMSGLTVLDLPLQRRILDHDQSVFIVQFAHPSTSVPVDSVSMEEEFVVRDGLRGFKCVTVLTNEGISLKHQEQLAMCFLKWMNVIIQRDTESRIDQLDRASRVVRNQFKVWFSSGQSKTRDGVVSAHRLGLNPRFMPYVYLWNSAEMRAFFLGSMLMIRKRFSDVVSVLRMVASDFRSDRSLIYSAAASESLGIALFLQGKTEISEAVDVLFSAVESYQQAEMFLDASRVLLLLTAICAKTKDFRRIGEFLLEFGLSDVTALRKSAGGISSSRRLCAALCLQLAGVCFQVLRRPSRKRTAHFCFSMAAECYASAAFFEDSRRLFSGVSDQLVGKAWSWMEAFTNLSAGRTAWMCGKYLEAYRRYSCFLSDLKPSRVDEVALLKETVNTASKLGDRVSECVCAFPLLDQKSIVVAEEFRVVDDTNLHEWKIMMDELHAFRHAELQSKPPSLEHSEHPGAAKLPSVSLDLDIFGNHKNSSERCLNVSAGENVVFTCRLENPLRAPVEVRDVCLVLRQQVDPQRGMVAEPAKVLHAPVKTCQNIQIPHNSDGLLRGVFAISETGVFELERITWKAHSPLFQPSLVCHASFDLGRSCLNMERNHDHGNSKGRSDAFSGSPTIRIGPPAPILTLRSPDMPKSLIQGQIWKTSLELVNVSLVTVHSVTLCWSPRSDFTVRVLRCFTPESDELILSRGNQVASFRCSIEPQDFVRLELVFWVRHHMALEHDGFGLSPRFLRFLILSETNSPSSTRAKLLPARLGIFLEDSVQISLCCLKKRTVTTISDEPQRDDTDAEKYERQPRSLIGFEVRNAICKPCALQLQKIELFSQTRALQSQPLFYSSFSHVNLEADERANVFMQSELVSREQNRELFALRPDVDRDIGAFLDALLDDEALNEADEKPKGNLVACFVWLMRVNGGESAVWGMSVLTVLEKVLQSHQASGASNLTSPGLPERALTLIPCEHGVCGKLLTSATNSSETVARVDERKIASHFAFWSGHIYRAAAMRPYMTDANLDVFLVVRETEP
jgi:hypothetical protein